MRSFLQHAEARALAEREERITSARGMELRGESQRGPTRGAMTVLRDAVIAEKRAHPGISTRDLAARVKCSTETVRKVLRAYYEARRG